MLILTYLGGLLFMEQFKDLNIYCRHIHTDAVPDSAVEQIDVRGEVLDVAYYKYEDLILSSQEEVISLFQNNIEDGPMQIICCRDLHIKPGVVLRPNVRCKGLVIYCTRKLQNDGEISMTKRGSYGLGQTIYIKNNEFIPAVGALGGASKQITWWGQVSLNGNNGHNGFNRATAGGGAGLAVQNANGWWNARSGAGGVGTSFTGGAGGGSGHHMQAGDADNYGKGGIGAAPNGSNWSASGSGAIPGPASTWVVQGGEGAGGLIIIYCNKLSSNRITSEGTNSNYGGTNNIAGGASGGGSINIFSILIEKEGTISAKGGKGVWRPGNPGGTPGSGGNGSVTISLLGPRYFLLKDNDEIIQ